MAGQLTIILFQCLNRVKQKSINVYIISNPAWKRFDTLVLILMTNSMSKLLTMIFTNHTMGSLHICKVIQTSHIPNTDDPAPVKEFCRQVAGAYAWYATRIRGVNIFSAGRCTIKGIARVFHMGSLSNVLISSKTLFLFSW